MQNARPLYYVKASNKQGNAITQFGTLIECARALQRVTRRLNMVGNVYRVQDNCPAGSPYKPTFWPDGSTPPGLVRVTPEMWRGLPRHDGRAAPPGKKRILVEIGS